MTDISPADIPAPLRLRLDGDALVANWRALDRISGAAACGAAIKADGYGLGAEGVATRLAAAGCRDFFVSNWREAAALAHFDLPLAVLHGVREEDMATALSGIARPVLNTARQVARWKAAGGGACDVMVDTGMNRLGVSIDDIGAGLLDGLSIDTLMSHLACADEESSMNERQRLAFSRLAGRTGARRMSLANSAGIMLGKAYAFDLTRPGLALYGGVPSDGKASMTRQVVFPEAEILQRRIVHAGDSVGYNATWIAPATTTIGIVNLGYADGLARGLSNVGTVLWQGEPCPLVGRVSMDLAAFSLSEDDGPQEGDWISISFDLSAVARATGRSQYELLTGLGDRPERRWS